MRDWSENEVQPIHNKLAAEFFEVCLRADQLGAGKKIWVHSGYRTRATNESLRLKNNWGEGLAVTIQSEEIPVWFETSNK